MGAPFEICATLALYSFSSDWGVNFVLCINLTLFLLNYLRLTPHLPTHEPTHFFPLPVIYCLCIYYACHVRYNFMVSKYVGSGEMVKENKKIGGSCYNFKKYMAPFLKEIICSSKIIIAFDHLYC